MQNATNATKAMSWPIKVRLMFTRCSCGVHGTRFVAPQKKEGD